MKYTPRQVLAAVVSLAVAAAVVYGIILVGSPSAERGRQLDSQRVNHLSQISFGTESYWNKNKKLPPTLSALASLREVYIESIKDPLTGKEYEYQRTGTTTYRLCATFASASLEVSADRSGPVSPFIQEAWKHPAGRYCYELDAKGGLFQPEKVQKISSCVLMKEKKTGKVDCYGCSGKICKDPPPGYETYTAPAEPGYVGIPYACVVSDGGCDLAQ